MIFGSRQESPPPNPNAPPPPPWIGVDTVPKKPTLRQRFDLAEYISRVTGFKKIYAKLLLVGFALSLGFVAYVYYVNAKAGLPPPPNANRPAIDKTATTSVTVLPPPTGASSTVSTTTQQ